MSEEPEPTLEEIEEARAEEEFISAPEDTVNNPLVPANAGGVSISSGNFMHEDFTGGSEKPINNEINIKEEIVENQEPKSIFDKPKAAPAPAPATPVAQPTVADASVAGAAPKKKSKAGLIVTLCVIFVLLIGGGLGVFFWLMAREAPENLVKDSFAKVFDSEYIGFTGTSDFDSNGTKGNINFDITKNGENLKLNGVLKIDDNKIKIDAIQYKSETYLKLDGIDNISISNLAGQSNGQITGSTATMLENIFKYAGKVVNDTWIKVDPSLLGNFMPSSGDCSFGLDTILNADFGKAKESYKDNAFIVRDESAEVSEKDGVKYIKVKADKDKMKSFLKALTGKDSGDKCDVKTDGDVASSIVFGVKPWSHDLSVVRINDGKEDHELKVNYDKKDIEKPENAKNLLAVASELEEAIKKGLSESAEAITRETCQASYGSYGSAYVELCIEQTLPTMKSYLENIDLGQLFGPMIQGFMGKLGGTSES